MSAAVLDGVTPVTRSDDPVTSLDAGRKAAMCASQCEVLALFAVEGRSLADHELVEVAKAWSSPYTEQRIRSARSELVEKGQVVPVEGEFRKTRTGHNAHVWTTPDLIAEAA